jgi:hypothetical protein
MSTIAVKAPPRSLTLSNHATREDSGRTRGQFLRRRRDLVIAFLREHRFSVGVIADATAMSPSAVRVILARLDSEQEKVRERELHKSMSRGLNRAAMIAKSARQRAPKGEA